MMTRLCFIGGRILKYWKLSLVYADGEEKFPFSLQANLQINRIGQILGIRIYDWEELIYDGKAEFPIETWAGIEEDVQEIVLCIYTDKLLVNGMVLEQRKYRFIDDIDEKITGSLHGSIVRKGEGKGYRSCSWRYFETTNSLR